MSSVPIYIDLSDTEIAKALRQQGVALEQEIKAELRKNGVSAQTEWRPNPLAEGPQDRELVLVILAAGVAASLVATAVAKVIKSVTGGRAPVTKRPALDGKGKPIRDANGNPVYEEIAAPSVAAPPQESERTSLEAFKVFKFEMSSGQATKGSK